MSVELCFANDTAFEAEVALYHRYPTGPLESVGVIPLGKKLVVDGYVVSACGRDNNASVLALRCQDYF